MAPVLLSFSQSSAKAGNKQTLNKIGRHFTLKSCHHWNKESKMGFQLLTLYCILYGRAVSCDKCDNLAPKVQRRLYLSKISSIFVFGHFNIIFKFHVFISNIFSEHIGQGCQRFETSVFFSVKINISTRAA